ncbi:MAG: hypothetical protein ABJQ53_20355 [Roseibium sp.]
MTQFAVVWGMQATCGGGGGTGDDTIFANGQNTTVDAGADNDVIVSNNTNIAVEGGSGNDWVFTNGAGSTTVTDSSGLQDVVYFYNLSGADIKVLVDGNDLLGSSATDLADGTNDNGFTLKDFFLSTDHIEFLMGNDNAYHYVGDVVV